MLARAASCLLVAGAALVLAVPAPAAFRGTPGKIAFSSEDDLWSVNPDGTDLRRLTTSPEDDAQAAYSPDGTRIAYRRRPAAGQPYQVYVMRSDGTDVRRLSQSTVNESQPGWSPDGARIAFRRGPVGDPNADVWVMGADGANPRALITSPGADERYPVFSPDGTKLAFTSSRDGQYEVYVSAADGTGAVRTTNDPNYDSAPAWSPDGSRLAFERATTIDAEATKDVWVMRSDGTAQTRLTATDGVDEGPSFSADGARIAFTSARDGDQEIYVMAADGAGPARVLTRPGTLEESPDWQAVPVATTPADPPGATVPTVPTVPTGPTPPAAVPTVDRDGDGLSAVRERALRTSDLDRDSDDDGLTDVREVRHTRTRPDRRDSDGDRVHDGTELGVRRPIADPPGRVRGTDCRRLVRDADPRTRTDARRRDSDRDGRADGREDRNRNGRVDRGETDPRRRGR